MWGGIAFLQIENKPDKLTNVSTGVFWGWFGLNKLRAGKDQQLA